LKRSAANTLGHKEALQTPVTKKSFADALSFKTNAMDTFKLKRSSADALRFKTNAVGRPQAQKKLSGRP